MVAGLGGPKNVLSPRFAGLAKAPVVIDVPAPRSGFVAAMNTRAMGLAVITLGGGRLRASDAVDARVGLAQVRAIGSAVRRGEPLAQVHARTRGEAQVACNQYLAAITLAEKKPARAPVLLWSSAPR